MIHDRPSVIEDVPLLMADVRHFGKQELTEALASAAIERGLFARTVFVHDRLLAVWGGVTASALEPVTIWAATTTAVDDHPLPFYRYAMRGLRDAIAQYGSVTGHLEFDAPRKWLERLGFEISEPYRGLMRISKWQ